MDTLTKQCIVASVSMGIPENYAVLHVGIVISRFVLSWWKARKRRSQ